MLTETGVYCLYFATVAITKLGPRLAGLNFPANHHLRIIPGCTLQLTVSLSFDMAAFNWNHWRGNSYLFQLTETVSYVVSLRFQNFLFNSCWTRLTFGIGAGHLLLFHCTDKQLKYSLLYRVTTNRLDLINKFLYDSHKTLQVSSRAFCLQRRCVCFKLSAWWIVIICLNGILGSLKLEFWWFWLH